MRKKNSKTYTVIGLMSGTSMDGLYIAVCIFKKNVDQWEFKIIEAETIAYDLKFQSELENAQNLPALEFWKLHVDFGRKIGSWVNKFLNGKNFSVDLISSHGHTIFHQPGKNGITCQIGHAAEIAAATGITTVSDFRSLDVAYNGQGAPLVPLGDKLLFQNFDSCLNLGGIANISIHKKNKTTAFDICAVNQIFNHLASWKNKSFDEGGNIGRQGKMIEELMMKLNSSDFYSLKGPKSLGREWVEKEILPLLNFEEHSTEDIANTYYKHVQFQIQKIFTEFEIGNCLISGGGANNSFLVELLRLNTKTEIIIPEKIIIEYKEALIFAFLGLLRYKNEENTLSSVTGAVKNSSGGCIYLP